MRLRLFASTKLTKGPQRSVIQNLITGSFHTIPNELYKICKSFNGELISQIKNQFNKNQASIILDYIEWLTEFDYAEIVNVSNSNDGFIALPSTWDYPATITNAIIDFGYHDLEMLHSIRNDLDYWNTTSIELRFFTFFELEYVLKCLELFSLGDANSLSVVLKHDNWDINSIDQLFNRFISINKLLIFDAKCDNLKSITLHNGVTPVIITTSNISASCCGIVSPEYFVNSIPFFNESQNFNSCLNRKISVDHNGEIRNCPSMPKSFGNISNTSLRNVIDTNFSFKEYWKVTKNHIDECKVCEFRNMCPDCRAYVNSSNHITGKPTKCNYDPFTVTYKTK
jgi:SPASM domain peptide maturase of grasp-with-spasm system